MGKGGAHLRSIPNQFKADALLIPFQVITQNGLAEGGGIQARVLPARHFELASSAECSMPKNSNPAFARGFYLSKNVVL